MSMLHWWSDNYGETLQYLQTNVSHCQFFLEFFINNTLHYTVTLHVLVFLY